MTLDEQKRKQQQQLVAGYNYNYYSITVLYFCASFVKVEDTPRVLWVIVIIVKNFRLLSLYFIINMCIILKVYSSHHPALSRNLLFPSGGRTQALNR